MLHALLFGLVVVATALVALRVGSAMAGAGWRRFPAAFVVFGAMAAGVPAISAAAGVHPTPAALAAITALVLAPLLWLTRGSPVPTAALEFGGRGRNLLLAAIPVFAVHELVWAGVHTDTFHLAEVASWLQDGAPGSPRFVQYEWPAEAYPMINDLILTYGVGIARSFAPLAFWTVAVTALLGGCLYLGLRERGVPDLAACLTVLAAVFVAGTLHPIEGAGTTVPSLAWMAAAVALVSHPTVAHRQPALALLAAGFAVGTKTNTAYVLVVLLPPLLWPTRSTHAWQLAAGAAGALLAAGFWPLRNLHLHGSPLWPFSDTLGGDPLPPIFELLDRSFWSGPVSALEGYVDRAPRVVLLIGVVLAAAAVLAAITRRRAPLLLLASVAVGLVLWGASPLSGRIENDGNVAVLLFYLLPVLVAAVTTAGLAGAEPALARGSAVVLLVVVALSGWAFPQWPQRLSAIGVVAAAAALSLLWPVVARARLPRRGWTVVAAVAIGAGTWAATDHYLRGMEPALRRTVDLAGTAGRIVTNFSPDGRLAGARLQHRIELVPPGTGCGPIRSLPSGTWFISSPPSDYREVAGPECLPGQEPVLRDAAHSVYRIP